ncbi:MAG: type 2 lanthipeptide synthetase LanM [Actinomycetes bacterium]
MQLMTDLESVIVPAGARWDDRLDASRGAVGDAPHESGAIPPAGEDRRRWQQAVDADDAGLFAKRLAWQGLTEESALNMLAGQPPPGAAPWLGTLASAQDALVSGTAHSPDASTWMLETDARLPSAARALPFAHVMWPIVTGAWDTLAQDIDQGTKESLNPAALTDMELALLYRLSAFLVRPLMEQFTAGRPPAETLMLVLGSDEGSDSRHRYASFCHHHSSDGLAGFLSLYPVAGRLIAATVEFWIEAMQELLFRLASDALALTRTFGVASPLHLQRIRLGEGDPHRRGRSVAIVELTGRDGSVQVVVKPKDMRIEEKFQALVAHIMGGPSTSPAVTVLAMGSDYGYASFVDYKACADERELERFYLNAGRLLALLHLLGTTDGHYENLIAHGDQLVLIDPETLFEGRVAPIPGFETEARDDAGTVVDMETTVLRTGLLPWWQREGPREPAQDISALGAEQPNEEALLVGGWMHVNTDAMAWGKRAERTRPVLSLPVPPGVRNPMSRLVDFVIAGFRETYQRTFEPDARADLITRIEDFRGARRRIVLRATRVYAVLQLRSQSPSCLASANSRAFELDRLSRGSLLGSTPTVHWQFFQAELHDMENLDIPYFDYPLGSRDIHASDRTIHDALVEDGLETAILRVRSTSAEDLAWQEELIRASVVARQFRMLGDTASVAYLDADREVTTADRDDALDDILGQLERSGIRDPRGGLTWLTLNPVGDGTRVQLGTLDIGFYSGRTGLIAFLVSLVQRTTNADMRSRASLLLEEVVAPLKDVLLHRPDYDTFRMLRDAGSGLAGTGGLLSVLGQDLSGMSAENARESQERIVQALLNGLINRDESLDLLTGSAGCIAPLVRLRTHWTDERVDRAIRLIAQRLADRQDVAAGGWSLRPGARQLTGMSHGASGMGLALLRAGVALDDPGFIESGARAFAYERAVFYPDKGNWPDFRGDQSDRPTMIAWCHGATGIGLSRMRALEILPDHPDAAAWREELRAASRITADAPLRELDHLCCGSIGRATMLDAVADFLKDDELRHASARITNSVVAYWRTSGAFRLNRFGPHTQADIPGFMMGASGIGMHLLGPDHRVRLLDLIS